MILPDDEEHQGAKAAKNLAHFLEKSIEMLNQFIDSINKQEYTDQVNQLKHKFYTLCHKTTPSDVMLNQGKPLANKVVSLFKLYAEIFEQKYVYMSWLASCLGAAEGFLTYSILECMGRVNATDDYSKHYMSAVKPEMERIEKEGKKNNIPFIISMMELYVIKLNFLVETVDAVDKAIEPNKTKSGVH